MICTKSLTKAEYIVSMFFESKERAILQIASTLVLAFLARVPIVAPQVSFASNVKPTNFISLTCLTSRPPITIPGPWDQRISTHSSRSPSSVSSLARRWFDCPLPNPSTLANIDWRCWLTCYGRTPWLRTANPCRRHNWKGSPPVPPPKFHRLGDQLEPYGTPEKISFSSDDSPPATTWMCRSWR